MFFPTMTLSSVNSLEKTFCRGSHSFLDTQHMKYYTPLCHVNAKFRNRVCYGIHKSCWGNNTWVLDSCFLKIFCKRCRFTYTETHISLDTAVCCILYSGLYSKMENRKRLFTWKETLIFHLCSIQFWHLVV